MLSSGWGIIIGIICACIGVIFILVSIFYIDTLDFNFLKFENTDKIKTENITCFVFVAVIAAICIYLFIYTLNFGLSEEYNVIEENKIDFFYDYSNSSLYEILYGNKLEDLNICNFILKDDNGDLYIKNYYYYDVKKVYKNIEQPYIIEIEAQRKNFLYHYDFTIIKLILPIKFKNSEV